MNNNKNNITYLPFDRRIQNLNIMAYEHPIAKNVVKFSDSNNNEMKLGSIDEENNALCIFELSCSFEKLCHTQLLSASILAALAAKIVIHARRLDMQQTIKFAQELGELAMQGNGSQVDKVRNQLRLALLDDLMRVKI